MRHILIALSCSLLTLACAPAPPPVQPMPPVPTERDAHKAFQQAKAKKDVDELLSVYNKFTKFRSGKLALREAYEILMSEIKKALEACDEPTVRGKLARLAPLTLDDPEINEGYDAMHFKINQQHSQCEITQLDRDLDALEAAWNWPAVFARLSSSATSSKSSFVQERRQKSIERWIRFLEDTARNIIEKRSVDAVAGNKRAALEASVQSDRLPAELASQLKQHGKALNGALLIFGRLQNSTLWDSPRHFIVRTTTQTYRPDPSTLIDGPTLKPGIPFDAIAQGSLNGTMLLVASPSKGTLIERISSIQLLVRVSDSTAKP